MSPPPNSKPASKTPLKFGKEEKSNPWKVAAIWVFVLIAIGAIIWMIATNSRQPELVCNTGAHPSLISFGSCSEQ